MRASLGRDRVSFKASKIRDGLDFTYGHDLVFFFRLFLSNVRSQKNTKKNVKKVWSISERVLTSTLKELPKGEK